MSKASNGGMGVFGVLGVVFVVLKLLGVIDWSWWWVLSPWWINACVWLVCLAIIGAVAWRREKRQASMRRARTS